MELKEPNPLDEVHCKELKSVADASVFEITNVAPSHIVLELGIVTNGCGTIVIVFCETAFIPQAEFPIAVSVKVTIPV